jgi:alkanesulfonate monooxygenase SsuD/methylene tetrahydromethanopterin reductase-like flavin-dependent oxidoreductase (luciferase family)
MKLALRLPQGGPAGTTSGKDIAKVAKAADSLGLWGVTFCDNLPTWSANDWRHYPNMGVSIENDSPAIAHADFYDPLTTITYVAGITERVKLVPCVIVIPQYHPIMLAKWAASVDQFSNGRLVFGLGIGGPAGKRNEKYLSLKVSDGYDIADPKVRGDMTDESIRAMKTLWTQDLSTFEGKYYKFKNIESFPKCVQSPFPPIWVAGWKARSCRRVAELGDGLVPNMSSPEEVSWMKNKIKQLAARTGRSDVDYKVFVETWACIANTTEEAWRVANRKMVEGTMSGHVGKSIDERRVLIGSVSDVMEKVQAFKKAGAYGFELRTIYPNIDNLIAQAKLFAQVQGSFS